MSHAALNMKNEHTEAKTEAAPSVGSGELLGWVERAERQYNDWLRQNSALVAIKLHGARRSSFWFLYEE